jgi:hypothetical protein
VFLFCGSTRPLSLAAQAKAQAVQQQQQQQQEQQLQHMLLTNVRPTFPHRFLIFSKFPSHLSSCSAV